MDVTTIIDKWYKKNKRDLPWRHTHSPYKIWLSEIILQQTRINQGLSYYIQFIQAFPSINDLACASIDEVLKLWQGLGYYTRARNLHETAQIICGKFNGQFPEDYSELIKLKGIGTYTAAAIASIAFNQPVALVDGNVSRLLARLFNIETPVDTREGMKLLHIAAHEILNTEQPGMHNQAVMEFGSLICLPKNPKCSVCVLRQSCKAFKSGNTEILPVKKLKIKSRSRYFNYLFITYGENICLHKRTKNDIWNSLYEFPMIETKTPVDIKNILSHPLFNLIFRSRYINSDSEQKYYRHQLTHQTLHCYFYHVPIAFEPACPDNDYIVVKYKQLSEFAIPRAIERYLADLTSKGGL
jgi:A/G-specific adenine glycosylase